MDQAARGDKALEASNYEEAIRHYTTAISFNRKSAKYHIKRSTAYQRAQRFAEALADIETAVVLAHDRGTRELIADAQYRRAIILYLLERYADADFVMTEAKRLNCKEKAIGIWELKIAKKLKELPQDDERAKVAVKALPEPSSEAHGADKQTQTDGASSPAPAPAPKIVTPTPANKIKNEWYQNNENVYLTLLAKGVDKEKISVNIERRSVSISFPIVASNTFDLTLEPTFAEVLPKESSYRVTPNKVEVTLKKANSGVKWRALEGEDVLEDYAEHEEKPSIPEEALCHQPSNRPPVYPTSSKTGPKDWDTIGDEDAGDDDYEGGDEANKFFKQLYKGATPEQQRAMMKSYQESGGTVLSTDWSNVGSKTVVPEPPEGMEAKQWGK